MKDLEYDEFEVALERSVGGYTARVVKSLTGLTPAMPFVPPVETAALVELRETMRGAGEATPAAGADQEGSTTVEAKVFGSSLFKALFNEKALNLLQTSQFVAANHGRGLRLRIRFSDVAELANLPWELLYDPDKHKFLCRHRAYPTIRMLDLPDPVAPFRVTGPLRMLVVISSPKDLPDLAVENEWIALQEELNPLVEAGRIDIERLPVPTLESLYAKASNKEFHVFHFIGHGGINANGEGHLAFVRPNGFQHKVPGSDLAVMLEHSPIRLAVLNSCEGGTVSAEDPFGSAAIALVEQGIPAVVAMQFPISDVAARTFSRRLYDSVAAGRSVDLGVTLGRQSVLAISETEWATPVLYLRVSDGVLFELEAGPVDRILPDPEPGSATWSDIVPVVVSEPEPEPPPELVAPVAPKALAGLVTEGLVDLHWHQDTPPAVHHWEVFRDDTLVARVISPRASDRPPGPGVFRYSVVATGEGSLQSSSSAPWEAVVPVPTSPQAPTSAVAPAAPTNVAGWITDGLVQLDWQQPAFPQVKVVEWGVFRNGQLIARVTSPEASDEPPGEGTYSYFVVATGVGKLQSPPSAAWEAVVPAGITPGPAPPAEPDPVPRRWRRAMVVIGLILALAVTAWLLLRPRGSALAAPTNVIAAFDTGLVSMTWDQVPADGPAVDRWEVFLDDARVTTVRKPEASFVPTRSGQIEYRVVAFAADGSRSDATAVAVTVPTDPQKTADVEISVWEVRAAEGDAVTVTFETDNLGKAEIVDEQVFVEAVGGGRLHAVSFKRGKTGDTKPCTVASTEATCDIGGHAIKGLVHVSATVEWAASSTGLRATVKDTAGTTDPKQKNNAATYERQLAPPASPTQTATASPTVTSTVSPTATPKPTLTFSPPEVTGEPPPNDG
ncbi:MAG TPA: CHAT domain-containing protein [Intrasporangium sp.]|nr:CHAT domain-containing protein [Intrasporangium sp.]